MKTDPSARKIKSYLQQKSLFGYLMHNTSKTLVLIFLGTFLFLLIFKPSVLDDYGLLVRLVLVFGYSIFASVAYIVSFGIFSPHHKKLWTKKLETGLFALCFIMAWLFNWGYTVLVLKLFWVQGYPMGGLPPLPRHFGLIVLLYTTVIGLILYFLIHAYDILITNERQKTGLPVIGKKNRVQKSRLTGRIPKTVQLHCKSGSVLQMETEKFIMAKIKGHYLQVCHLDENNEPIFSTLRNSMLNIEDQLVDASNLYRCHKSYIINLDHLEFAVNDTKKNKSYAKVKFFDQQIPVSPRKIRYLRKMGVVV